MTITEKLPPQRTLEGHTFNADLAQGPYYFDGCDTLPKLFRQRCEELGQKIAHREKDYGIWLAYSWSDFYEHARLIGLGLLALGLKRGEAVSVLSEDNKEWIYADLAIQCVGGVTSGVYTTDSASQLKYLVNDSDSRFLFVENDEQLDKFLSVADEMPRLGQGHRVRPRRAARLHPRSGDVPRRPLSDRPRVPRRQPEALRGGDRALAAQRHRRSWSTPRARPDRQRAP